MGFQTTASNPDPRFTCPACYTDQQSTSIGYRVCENPDCNVELECSIENVPQYTARVCDPGEKDDD